MIDMVAPQHGVEVLIEADVVPKTVKLWVNVDGKCVLRVSQIPVSKLDLNIPAPSRLIRIGAGER